MWRVRRRLVRRPETRRAQPSRSPRPSASRSLLLTALSWADLTYVLPATAVSYILMVLLAKFFLHEHVTIWRWLGVALITIGVGFVATGPEATPGAHCHNREAVCEPATLADAGSEA